MNYTDTLVEDILIEDYTNDEKMNMWVNGTRDFNFGAAGIPKLKGNTEILINIYRNTKNVSARNKAQILINEIRTRTYQDSNAPKYADDLQDKLDKTTQRIFGTGTQQQASTAKDWKSIMEVIFQRAVQKLEGSHSQDFARLLKSAKLLLTNCAFFGHLNYLNPHDLLDGLMVYTGGEWKPYDKEAEKLLESQNADYLAEAVVQQFLAKLAVINIFMSLQNFFETKGCSVDDYNVALAAAWMHFVLGNFKKEVAINNPHDWDDNVTIKVEFSIFRAQAGLWSSTIQTTPWRDMSYKIAWHTPDKGIMDISGRANELPKLFIEDLIKYFNQ